MNKENQNNEEVKENEKIKENDKVLEKDYLSSLIEQEERLVYYEIENIYKNDKDRTYKNKIALKREPPILIIKDDYGNEAEFYLTENFTDELIGALKEVKRAYLGFSGPVNINVPSKFIDKIKYYIKNNPIKIIMPIIIIIMTLILYNM